MAVHYVGGGGGLFGSLGKALGLGSMFIPGLQPFAAGMNLIGGLANGDPVGALMGGLGMMKGADGKPLLGGKGGLFGSLFGGGYKQPMANDSFYDAMSGAHNQNTGLFPNQQLPTDENYGQNMFVDFTKPIQPTPNWGEEFGTWNRIAPPQYAKYGNLEDMYTNQWAGRYRR